MKSFIIVVMGVLALVAFLFGDVEATNAQSTDCLFTNPDFTSGGGGWTLGAGVEQEATYAGMPNFSTVGQNIQFIYGDYILEVNVVIWKDPETEISSTDFGNLVTLYYQFPADGTWTRLEPGDVPFARFANADPEVLTKVTFTAHIYSPSNTWGVFTIFALVSAPVEGVSGIGLEYACLERAVPVSGGGGGGNNCDELLPCGPLPWALPSLPDLSSPTPLPTSVSNPTGVPTDTSGFLIIPTSTPAFDVSEMNDAMGTLQAYANGTAYPIVDLQGTPYNSANELATLTANTSTAFGYARGLADISFGPLTPLVTFTFTAIFTFLFFNTFKFLFPMIIAVFGVIRKIVQLILDFLPF